MPLPLIIGAIAGAAATLGAGAGIYGASKIMEANEIKESAQKRKEKAVKLYKDKESELTALLDPLGKNELEIVKSFAEFSDIIEKISDKPDFNVHFKENGISDIKIQKIGDLNLKDLSIWADTALASLSGAAAGVAGGFATSGAITALVAAFGSASTGTAISTLSGAALTNAILACLGGGSLVIGGGGMALGSLALGLTTGGIGLLIGGSVLALIGSNKTDEAEKEIESAEETERQVDKFIHYYDELITYASHFKDALCGIKELYEEQLKRLDYVVNVLGKVHWSDFADGEKQLTKTTVFLVELLYKMCNTGLVQKEKNSDGFNSVNKFEVDSIVSEASIILDNAKGNK